MRSKKFGNERVNIYPTLPKRWQEEYEWDMKREANKGPVRVFSREEIEAYEEELRKEGRI